MIERSELLCPSQVIYSIRRNGVAEGPITAPVGEGFKCKCRAQERTRSVCESASRQNIPGIRQDENVDIVIVGKH